MGDSSDKPTILDSGNGPRQPSGPQPGQRWGKFLIEKVLGRGGQADVLQAFDQAGAAGHVALKVPHKAIPAEYLRVWLESEVGTLAKLDHPNIVRVADAGAVGRFPYVATALVDGLPMAEYVRAAPPSDREIADWLIRLCDALDAAHRRGVIHRDLKPHNVIITPEGKPLLIDFGMASLVTAYQVEGRTDASGSYPFMAPEQARRDPNADHRVDVFGMGGILKFLLTGEGPYEGFMNAARAARAGKVRRIGEIRGPGIRRSLIRIANRALSPVPDDRFQNMEQMGRSLRRARSRRLLPVWGGVAAAVLAVAVVALASSRTDGKARDGALQNDPATSVQNGGDGGGENAGEDQSAGPPKPERQQARVHVLCKRKGQPGSMMMELTKMRTPLRVGDTVKVRVTLAKPLHAYVFAAGPGGSVELLHPLSGEEDKPTEEVILEPAKDGRKIERAGIHMILVAARENGGADTQAMKEGLSRFPLPAQSPLRAVLVWDESGARGVSGGTVFRLERQPGATGRWGFDKIGQMRERMLENCDAVSIVMFTVQGVEGRPDAPVRRWDRRPLRDRRETTRPQ